MTMKLRAKVTIFKDFSKTTSNPKLSSMQ